MDYRQQYFSGGLSIFRVRIIFCQKRRNIPVEPTKKCIDHRQYCLPLVMVIIVVHRTVHSIDDWKWRILDLLFLFLLLLPPIHFRHNPSTQNSSQHTKQIKSDAAECFHKSPYCGNITVIRQNDWVYNDILPQ